MSLLVLIMYVMITGTAVAPLSGDGKIKVLEINYRIPLFNFKLNIGEIRVRDV